MAEKRNIVILGASFAGIHAAQYVMKHILPALKAKHNAKYHVYVISPSSDFYFRVAAPRTATSTTALPAEQIFASLDDVFKDFPASDFTFVKAAATALDATQRTVSYRKSDYLQDETLSYHALVVATGSSTHHPAFSNSTDTQATMNAIKTMNKQVRSAKDIIVVGGGPTGVEVAAEIGEFLNGKPGWFFNPPRKANVTLLTATNHLLPTLRPAIGKQAENKLKALGVDVLYNTRVADVSETRGGRTTLTLAKGEKLEADLYVPAHGVLPNSSYLPANLLTDTGYLKSNSSTLRVDAAGPRVYAIGDISSASRNKIADLYAMQPVLYVNLKRDLLSYTLSAPNDPAPGKDREYKAEMREMLGVVVGSGGGVGAVMGWKLPNWVIWLTKSRNFMVSLGMAPLVNGKATNKEVKWTSEEAIY